MFYNTSIDSKLDSALITYDCRDHYIFGSNLRVEGFDDRGEYYILAREKYEDLEKELGALDAERIENGESYRKNLISCIEDPVLMSPDEKYLIYVRREFGHFVLNTLVSIMTIYESNPEAIFVFFIEVPEKGDEDLIKIVKFLQEFLGNHKINYYFLRSSYFLDKYDILSANSKSPIINRFKELSQFEGPTRHYLVYKVKNAFGVDSGLTTSRLTVKDIKYLIDKYVNNYSEFVEKPYRKIYITRGVYEKEDNAFADGKYKSNQIRIYEENIIEKYLSANGFEIVNFSKLSSIQEQINYMRGTAVLVGATGTGLTNMLFMQDSKVLVELRVESGNFETGHWLPLEYSYLSSGKNHVHIAIDVKDKQAKTAIKRLGSIIDTFDLTVIAEKGA